MRTARLRRRVRQRGARQDQVQRDRPRGRDEYTVQDGQLNVTTVDGDIYTNGDPAPTRNFFLQTADHAAAGLGDRDEGRRDELSGGYEQAGLMVRKDDDNYIKFDIISDDRQTVLNRIELRSEVAGAIQNAAAADPPLPAGRRRPSGCA